MRRHEDKTRLMNPLPKYDTLCKPLPRNLGVRKLNEKKVIGVRVLSKAK